MKNIMEQFPKNKVSGIYRIWIQVGKHQFSFVSNSQHILGDIKQYRNKIQKHFNNSKFTQELLKEYAMPEKNDDFFSFAVFLMAKTHKLEINDIKYEILEEINDYEHEELVDDREQSYIEEFQCEKYGFNSTFKYLEKFIQATMHNMEQKVEIYKEKWKAQEKRIVELYATHDQNHINLNKWYKNPTNAFILLDRGYISDPENYFKMNWKNFFDNIAK